MSQLTLFGHAMDSTLHRPKASDAALLVLAEIAVKEDRYGLDGVPAVGFRKAQLDRLTARGWLTQTRLADLDVEEGPRRLHLTEAGRHQVHAYDMWAESWGYTTVTEYASRVMRGAF